MKRNKRKSTNGQKKDTFRKGGNSREEREPQIRKDDCGNHGRRMGPLSPLNDMSWYNHNPLLTQAAASVPFPYRPGMNVTLGGTEFHQFNIPGVMQINWIPSIGYCERATDPANIAARDIFAAVRSSFSGSIEADPQDFIIYFMALDSVFSYIGSLKRIFRILNTYTPMNYMIPDVLLHALGCTDSTIINLKRDRMQLYQVINELIGMTHKLNCPAVFDVFNRHYWLNDNVYTDAESANSQLYVFQPVAYYQFALVNTPDKVPAGGLTMVPSPIARDTGDAVTVDALYSFGKQLIDAISGSDDAYIISGYLSRTYQGTPAFSVDEVTLDQAFNPVFVPEVLAQIENSWSLGAYDALFNPAMYTVSQDPKSNILINTPKFDSALVGSSILPFISVRSDQPSVVDVVEDTRLKTMLTDDLKVICGTEVVVAHNMYAHQNYNNNKKVLNGLYKQVLLVDQTDPTPESFVHLDWLVRATVFDWHPLAIVGYSADGAVWSPAVMGDIHNFTTISKQQLMEINKVCLYSEFNAFGLQ